MLNIIFNLETNLNDLKEQLTSFETELKASQLKEEESIETHISSEEIKEDEVKEKKISKDKISYDDALSSLKEGNFEEAENKFMNFIKEYPATNLHCNALFWYAESFNQRALYNKAALNYLKCYKSCPQDTKASDALLKLAHALHFMNKKNEACSMLDKLEKEFQDRSTISQKRSIEARNTFGCIDYKKN